jgi:hypothetical protein
MSLLFFLLTIVIFLQGGPPPSSYPPPPAQQQQPAFYPQEQQSILLASLEQYQGTVFPSPNFNAEADCQALSHAMKGAGILKCCHRLIQFIVSFKVLMNVLLSRLSPIDRMYNVNKLNFNTRQCMVWYVYELNQRSKDLYL